MFLCLFIQATGLNINKALPLLCAAYAIFLYCENLYRFPRIVQLLQLVNLFYLHSVYMETCCANRMLVSACISVVKQLGLRYTYNRKLKLVVYKVFFFYFVACRKCLIILYVTTYEVRFYTKAGDLVYRHLKIRL